LFIWGLAENTFAELNGDFCNLRVKLGQRIGARFLNLVGRIINDPARIYERMFARLRDNPSPAFARFLPYARRFKLRLGDADPMLRKQLARFGFGFLGVLQAACYSVSALGSNLQSAWHEAAENREDGEEKHEAQNHLG
jgi:hypothetical protein